MKVLYKIAGKSGDFNRECVCMNNYDENEWRKSSLSKEKCEVDHNTFSTI